MVEYEWVRRWSVSNVEYLHTLYVDQANTVLTSRCPRKAAADVGSGSGDFNSYWIHAYNTDRHRPEDLKPSIEQVSTYNTRWALL